MEDGSDAPPYVGADIISQRPDAALANFLISLRSSGIRRNAILTAFEETHRRAFLPGDLKAHAYAPFALPLGCGEEATPPAAIARLLNAADPAGSDRVLEIGTGSGFQTALLARLCRSVVSIERWSSLLSRASLSLDRQGLRNVTLHHGDGLQQTQDERFDLIIVNASLPTMPRQATEWLKPGGRLLAAIGRQGEAMVSLFCRKDSSFEASTFGLIDLTPARHGVSRVL